MAEAKNMIDQVMDPHKFDLRTHIWDSQGRLVKKNLYTLYVINGEQYYERPINSGNLWTGGNQPIGRIERKFGPKGEILSRNFDHSAPHEEYTPELIGDEAIMYQLEQERAHRVKLEAELAAIKADSAVKITPKTAHKEAPTGELRLRAEKDV